MKKTLLTLAVLACAAVVTACGGDGAKVTKGNKNKLDTVSYCIGADFGQQIKYQFGTYNLDIEEFKSAVKDGLRGKSDLSSVESDEILNTFFSQTLPERQTEFDQKKLADSTLVFNAFVDEKENKKIAYALGSNIGTTLRKGGMKLQYYWVLKAIEDAQNGELELDEQQMGGFMQRYFTETLPKENGERSEKWLKKVSKRRGVKQSESGLLYKVIEEGDMSLASTDDADLVSIHYIWRNQSGEVIQATRFEDNTKEVQEILRKNRPSMFDEEGNPLKDEPVQFSASNVFPGLVEGMKLVGPGGKVQLFIPAELAFGEQGARGAVGPNEAVEFEIEVVSVSSIKAAAERSEKWLAEKALEEGVKKTESGLLYQIIESGNMKKAAKNDGDTVKVTYVGKLQDGTEFDSGTHEFPLNGVIKGWTEGMKLVGPGGKIKLFIPAELAYGSTGAGGKIGPNEALEFEVELHEVKPMKK